MLTETAVVPRCRLEIIGCSSESVEGLRAAWSLLSAEEHARADRFHRDSDRTRFILAHAGLRTILGHALDRSPESLTFAAGSHGKPHLADGQADLRFNLSHSGDYALVAYAYGRDVGVDIEQERPIEALALARAHFSQAECEALERTEPSRRIPAFFRIWTRKESFVKAHGTGLSFPLRDFDVSVDDEPGNLLIACRDAAAAAFGWTVIHVDAPPGYIAALTIEQHSAAMSLGPLAC